MKKFLDKILLKFGYQKVGKFLNEDGEMETNDPWEAVITRVGNGFIITSRGDGFGSNINVFEIKDDNYDENKEEQEAFVNMVFHLKDFFGVMYNKYHNTAINISIDKQEQ